MSKVKVAINGFGRIGRLVLRAFHETDTKGLFEIVAANDIGATPEQMAYLFKYDSVHGRYKGTVSHDDSNLIVDGKPIKVLKVSKPEELPWKEMGVDIVIESTGVFTSVEKASLHIQAGAKKVLITAPGSGDGLGTFVMGVNEETYDPKVHNVISNASCTTNCLAPVAKVLNDEFGIVKGLMTTVHAYTGDQKLVDTPHKNNFRARAAAVSLVPTTTGAAKAVSLVIPALKGKLNGMALRVPTPDVSVVDLVVELAKPATVEEINAAIKKAADGPLSRYLAYEPDDCVSVDFVHDSHSSVFAPGQTLVIDNMVKVFSWYDNEWGYSCRCVDLVDYIIERGL